MGLSVAATPNWAASHADKKPNAAKEMARCPDGVERIPSSKTIMPNGAVHTSAVTYSSNGVPCRGPQRTRKSGRGRPIQAFKMSVAVPTVLTARKTPRTDTVQTCHAWSGRLRCLMNVTNAMTIGGMNAAKTRHSGPETRSTRANGCWMVGSLNLNWRWNGTMCSATPRKKTVIRIAAIQSGKWRRHRGRRTYAARDIGRDDLEFNNHIDIRCRVQGGEGMYWCFGLGCYYR